MKQTSWEVNSHAVLKKSPVPLQSENWFLCPRRPQIVYILSPANRVLCVYIPFNIFPIYPNFLIL